MSDTNDDLKAASDEVTALAKAAVPLPYVEGWSLPRTYDEALAEVKKLRNAYAAKCLNLEVALSELTKASGADVEAVAGKNLLANQELLIAEGSQQRQELAMLCRRLMRRLPEDDALVMQTYEYLERKNLLGSPLRKSEEPK